MALPVNIGQSVLTSFPAFSPTSQPAPLLSPPPPSTVSPKCLGEGCVVFSRFLSDIHQQGPGASRVGSLCVCVWTCWALSPVEAPGRGRSHQGQPGTPMPFCSAGLPKAQRASMPMLFVCLFVFSVSSPLRYEMRIREFTAYWFSGFLSMNKGELTFLSLCKKKKNSGILSFGGNIKGYSKKCLNKALYSFLWHV